MTEQTTDLSRPTLNELLAAPTQSPDQDVIIDRLLAALEKAEAEAAVVSATENAQWEFDATGFVTGTIGTSYRVNPDGGFTRR